MNLKYYLFLTVNLVIAISLDARNNKIESRQLSFFPQNDDVNHNKRNYYDSPIQNLDTFRFSNDHRTDLSELDSYQKIIPPEQYQFTNVGENGGVVSVGSSIGVSNGGNSNGFGFYNDPNQNNIIKGINYPNNIVKKKPKKIKPNYNPSYTPYPTTDPNNPYFQNVNYAGTYNMYYQQQRPSPQNPYNPNGPPYNPYISPIQQQQAQYQQQYQPNPSSYYSSYAQQQNYNYANRYGNYRPHPSSLGGSFGNELNSGPISNYYNNIRGENGNPSPVGTLGSFGGQFGKALDDISQFDDLQCVPKLVCTMIGNPRRPTSLPSFLNEPTLTALISAVPSTSPLLVFGRAALLGLSVGERSCDTAYPKCPRNEDDLLYYLNNHRGGFFRFFNGGAAFGDDSNSQNYQNLQYQQQNYQNPYTQQGSIGGQQQQQNLNLGALQGLADTINQSGGINLSNLGANLGLIGNLASLIGTMNGANGNSGSTGAGLSQAFGNLLTGLVGSRFSRKVHKRSIEEKQMTNTDKKLQLENIEARIINHNDAPDSEFFPNKIEDTKLVTLEDIYQDELKASKKPNKDEFNFIFPNDSTNKRTSKRINFFPNTNKIKLKENETVRMIFPGDRTGTGNLKFDNEYFETKRYNINDNGFRIGKILSGSRPVQASASVDRYYNQHTQNANRPSYIIEDSSKLNNNPHYSAYGDRIRNPQNNYNYNQNPQIVRYSDTNHENYSDKIYVTNSQGKIEYYIDTKTGVKQYI